MPQPFNPARAMGIAPRSYDDYFGEDGGYQSPYAAVPPSPVMIGAPDDPTGSYTLSGVQSQPFAQPMALTQFDPVANEAANQAAAAAQAQRAAQADILSGNTDWTSDEGRGKLQDYVARGAISPTQARAMIYSIPKEPKLNRYSQVPVEVAQGLNKLAQIDPTDPDAWSNLQKTVAHESIPVDVQSHPQFQSDFKELKREILSHKQQQIALGKHDPDEELMNKALDAGIAPEELNTYLDENGKLADKAGLRYAVSQAKNTPANTGESAKKLADMLLATIQPPTDEEKNAWLAQHPEVSGADKFTQAWNGVKAEKTQLYNEYRDLLNQNHYRKLPSGIQQGVPHGTSQVAPQQQIPTFNTPEEAEASGVPAGTVVIINGKKFRKT